MLNVIGVKFNFLLKRCLTQSMLIVLALNVLVIKSAYAAVETNMVESVAPAFVFIGQCCTDAEFKSADAAFSAMKAIWDQNNTLPWGAVVTRTAHSLKPWPAYPTYNGVPSYYVSSYTMCNDSDCSENPNAGPTVVMSMRCPEDVVKVGGGEYGFSLTVKSSNGMAREVACERTIPLISPPEACAGNPIAGSTGEKIQVETDYKSPDGVLEFTRTYRSIKGLSTSLTTKKLLDHSLPTITPSFTSSACFGSWYTENTASKKRIPVCFKYLPASRPEKNYLYHVYLESGQILVLAGASNPVVLNNGASYMLHKYTNGQGKTEYMLRTGKALTELFDENGNLIRTTFPSGKIRTYVYSDSTTPVEIAPREGLLLSMADSSGNSLRFFYNSYEQLVKMKDPANKEYLYEYDTYNNLTAVVYPGGARRQYAYGETNNINAGVSCGGSNDKYARLLTGITDEKNVRFADFKYNCQAKGISTEHAGAAEKVSLTYNSDGSTTVTNALNKQTIYRFADIAGARRVVKVEGQPTANCAGANQDYTYTPEGWVESKTDWKGIKTTYQYNSLGQEISRTEAFGTSEARTIITEWHPTLYLKTKVTEPTQETTFNYDANGRLLNQSVRTLTN